MTHSDHPPHSRRDAATWAQARADFEAGASIRIVAERHGLNVRTVSRHAQAEGWRKLTASAHDFYAAQLRERVYDDDTFDEMACAAADQLHDEERLLLRPDSLFLCRFAFRRASECAAVSGPVEALAWMRLAQATARFRERVDVDVRPVAEADFRRVAAMRRETAFQLMDAGLDDEVSESVPRFSSDSDTSE